MNYPLPQPGYPPQYPQPPAQIPPQGYPVQPAAPQFPGYPQPPAQGYAPQPYAGGYPAPAAPPVPLATGTIDQFYSQPTGTSGPGISWKGKPEGTTYVGLVARDVQQGDIVQDSDFKTQQPKYIRGNPVWVMKIPLLVQPNPEHPEGQFTFYVRGQAREELVRAMAQVGLEGAPKAGALIQVTLVQRKPTQSGINANIVQITYTPDHGQVPAPVQQPQVQYQPVQYPQQPPAWAAPTAPAPVQLAQPVQYQQAPAQQQYAQAPAAATPPPAQAQAVVPAAPQVQQAPVAPQQGPGAPVPPPGLDPNAANILQQLTGAQPVAQG